MNLTRETRIAGPPWCDAVMRTLPEMYRRGDVSGIDDSGFVYAVTFFSVKEEVRRGASERAVRSGALAFCEPSIAPTAPIMTRSNSPDRSHVPSMTHSRTARRVCCNRRKLRDNCQRTQSS